MPVHVARYSKAFALRRILFSLIGWSLLLSIPGALVWAACLLVRVRPPVLELVMLAVGAALVLAWLIHSRSYWRMLWDRSPQIEVHPKYLRAQQLGDNDILLKDILDIRGQQLTAGEVIASSVVLDVRGEGDVELDLSDMDVTMSDLYLLLYEARQSALAPPPPPGRPPSVVKGASVLLGEEMARFRPSVVAEAFELVLAGVFLVGTPALGGFLYSLAVPLPWVLLAAIGILVPAVPLSLRALFAYRRARRSGAVLYQNGLVYGGSAVRYDEVWQVDLLTAGRSFVVLSLRDGTTLRLSGLKDTEGLSRRITEQAARTPGEEKPTG